MRVGWGIDAHRFAPSGTVLLGGVIVDETKGVAATSDGDVVAHALIDALLGAAVLGDIGERYPSSDPRWRDADSMEMLADTVAEVGRFGFAATSVDVTVIAEQVRVDPYRDLIRQNIGAALGIGIDRVSVKATTTDGLGFTGRDEGLAAMVTVVVDRSAP